MADFPLAVVTGGAHRLGRAFALTLAYQGLAVLVHYHRSAEQAAKTVAEIKTFGVPAFSMQADLTRTEHVESLFQLVDSLLEAPELETFSFFRFGELSCSDAARGCGYASS